MVFRLYLTSTENCKDETNRSKPLSTVHNSLYTNTIPYDTRAVCGWFLFVLLYYY